MIAVPTPSSTVSGPPSGTAPDAAPGRTGAVGG
ncbi:Uncharacterised protein [Kocuria rosea]|nr:Uncharacterised protein [Kocuria rosea]